MDREIAKKQFGNYLKDLVVGKDGAIYVLDITDQWWTYMYGNSNQGWLKIPYPGKYYKVGNK